MGWRTWVTIAGFQAAVLMAVAPAAAEFRVCNNAGETVDVAFGYEGGANTGWIAEGWYQVRAGRCVTVYGGQLNGRYYYLYAEGASGTEWNGDDSENASFCINRNVFKLFQRRYGDNDEEDCKKHNLESKRFFEVDVGDDLSWTQTLDGASNQPTNSPRPPPQTSAPPGAPPPRGSACERFPNLC